MNLDVLMIIVKLNYVHVYYLQTLLQNTVPFTELEIQSVSTLTFSKQFQLFFVFQFFFKLYT